MNTVTAIRTFAQPGFSPAKRTKIYAGRYYVVTMQNVERNPMFDYVGLGDGEYTQLVTGTEARNRRDARLNHCNRIQEWNGPVFAVLTSQYGNFDTSRRPVYFGSQEDVDTYILSEQNKHVLWISDVVRELNKHILAQVEKPEDWRASAIRDCQKCLDTRRDAFKFESLKIR
jgi:hypothetical protein